MEKDRWGKRYTVLTLAFAFLLAVFLCLALYQCDNKYTSPGPKGEKGILPLSEKALSEHPLLFLVEGWEYYEGRLLAPEDFAGEAPAPDEYIYIGQYGGFDASSFSAQPHGSATYRLSVTLPEVPRRYTLELPEIYSSYRLYLNGKLLQSMGEPDPESYRAETGNRVVTIEAAGALEILIAASDFSHIYSGMVYPPAFGDPEAIANLLSARLAIRCLFVSTALVVGLLALLVGLSSGRRREAVFYGLLCLFFVGYTSYPIVKTLFAGVQSFYRVESFSFCAMLTVVMLLQRVVYPHAGKEGAYFIGFGFIMCAASLIMPFALPGGNLLLMGAYSYMTMAFEWLTAGYVTLSASRSLLTGNPHSKLLLAGMLFFDAALVMDRLLPLYEPMVGGWFPEIASFVLALCIGAAVGKEIAAKYRETAVLSERAVSMERLSEMQVQKYEQLKESMEETRAVQHDLRHHFVMIEGFLQKKQYDQLEGYIREFQKAPLRMHSISISQNAVTGVLAEHYAHLAKKNGIEMKMKLDVGRETKVSDCDLCIILSNLLENAIEACLRQERGGRYIALSVKQTPSTLSIRVENSTDGLVKTRSGILLSSKEEGRRGYGLESVRDAAKRYDGDSNFQYDNEKGTFVSTVLLA